MLNFKVNLMEIEKEKLRNLKIEDLAYLKIEDLELDVIRSTESFQQFVSRPAAVAVTHKPAGITIIRNNYKS